jgi:sugar phosphate permease
VETGTIKTYGYRWVVLIAFMLVTAMTQVLWITFAPITSEAVKFYSASELMIGLLSMCFMIVYIVIVLPCAWLIDSRGFHTAVGLGAIITGIFALARGIFAERFTLVLVFQVGIAIGQPLVIGATTKLAARWFPVDERALATGFGTLALYLGILVGMLVTPMLAVAYGMKGMLLVYGVAAAVFGILFVVIAREHPPTPPGPAGTDERSLMFDGLKEMLRKKDFIILLVIFFVGLGVFNGVSTWIELIVGSRVADISQAGVIGGLMLIGGIVGAVIVPLVSDKLRLRKPFVIAALIGLLPGLLGLTFARSYWLLLLSGFGFGFFLLSAGPIGFQYGAELAHPGPEGTSNSLLFVMGQVSGIVFIFGMDALKSPTGAMTGSLLGLIGLFVICAVLAFIMEESPIRSGRKPG